jgi:hypothetical protein
MIFNNSPWKTGELNEHNYLLYYFSVNYVIIVDSYRYSVRTTTTTTTTRYLLMYISSVPLINNNKKKNR